MKTLFRLTPSYAFYYRTRQGAKREAVKIEYERKE